MSQHLFKYKWFLKDGYPAPGIAKNNLNVFGTFICGGGSTMGYKLAGFNHLGGVEIDPKIAAVYKLNHNPRYLYNEDIREFNKRIDLPKELYQLDILDGSPPCSTFSMAGSREKGWGKEKHFREGQAKQVLDDLVFVYCDTIIKLQPKVFILENVKGIISGNAKVYSKNIVKKMTGAGYTVQVFCLNAASMGVPQKRERVFFIGYRKEFGFPKLILNFDEEKILFSEISTPNDDPDLMPSDLSKKYWRLCLNGRSLSTVHPTGSWYNHIKLSNTDSSPTLTADNKYKLLHPDQCRRLSIKEWLLIGSYPIDYNFNNIEPQYLIGMSVPPVMTAQIANQINIQWLSKIKTNSIINSGITAEI
jgi:DNA (cytosine-5)-methyltransferase 1